MWARNSIHVMKGSSSLSRLRAAWLASWNVLMISLSASRPSGRPACPADEDPDRSLSGLDPRIVAVGQHLNPLDGALGEGRPHLLLDAVGRQVRHVVLRELPADITAERSVTCVIHAA